MSTATKLNYALENKKLLKDNLITMNVELNGTETYRELTNKVLEIQSGNGGNYNIESVDLGDGSQDLYITDAQGGGSGESGGATLNIEYSETPPTDTTKLWIKTTQPTKTLVGNDLQLIGQVYNEYNFSTGRYGRPVARIGNKIYIFGVGSTNYSISVYNIDDKSFTEVGTTGTTGVTYGGACVYGTDIYILGGSSDSNKIKKFDTLTNTFSVLQTPTTDSSTTYSIYYAYLYNNKIYFYIGNSGAIKSFDPQSLTVTSLGTIEKEGACGGIYNGKLYTFGNGTSVLGSKSVYIYNLNLKTYETYTNILPNELKGNKQSTACMVGNKVYIFGNYINGDYGNKIIIYDIETNTASYNINDNIFPTYESASSVDDGKGNVYMIGGRGTGGAGLTTINKLSLAGNLEQDNVYITTGQENKCNLIKTENVEIRTGVSSVHKGNNENIAEQINGYLFNGTNWVNILNGEIYN